jgi:hypothetical protein
LVEEMAKLPPQNTKKKNKERWGRSE